MIGDAWGIRRPFEVAFFSFLLATLYVRVAIPHIPAETLTSGSEPKSKRLAGMYAPLRVLAPQRVLLEHGGTRKHYGVLFLCGGVFLGVVGVTAVGICPGTDADSFQLATGYAPLLIQMYATAVFEFRQGDNGWLMSGFAFMRAAFLLFLFPQIISRGRKWYLKRDSGKGPRKPTEVESLLRSPLATNPEELEAPVGTFAQEEPVELTEVKEDEGTAFDLFFLRISLVVDGVLTMCAAFATESWHIYLGMPTYVSDS